MKSSWFIYAITAALLLIALFMLLPGKSIEYDFLEDEGKRWQITQGGTRQFKSDRLAVQAGKQWAMLASPRGGALSSAYWRQLPYVRFSVASAEVDRYIALAWLPQGKQLPELTLTGVIPANAEYFVFDVRSPPPYKRQLPWTIPAYGRAPVKQFGILLPSGTGLELKEITLLSKLNVIDFARVIMRQYLDTESFQAYAINAYYGARVLGKNLGLVLGIVFALAVLVFLVFRNRRAMISMVSVGVACFLLQEIPFDVHLFNHWRDSLKTSAWVFDKYEEYESRFGRDFSLLAREVDEKVPRGSKVMFLQPAESFGGEVSWPSVQFDGPYDVAGGGASAHWQTRYNKGQTPAVIRRFDYIVYHKSLRYRHDEKTNRLLEKGKKEKNSIKVSTLAAVSPQSKLLKVIRE